MNGHQQAVLWMGLILIILKLFTTGQWSGLWATIGNGSPAVTSPAVGTKPAAKKKAAPTGICAIPGIGFLGKTAGLCS